MLRLIQCCLVTALVIVALVGCEGKTPAEKPAEKASGTPTAAALTVLAKADAVDGTTDKVVGKCLTCSLGMDGKAEHAATYGEYTLHLCKDGCKKNFEADPEKALASVKIPE